MESDGAKSRADQCWCSSSTDCYFCADGMMRKQLLLLDVYWRIGSTVRYGATFKFVPVRCTIQASLTVEHYFQFIVFFFFKLLFIFWTGLISRECSIRHVWSLISCCVAHRPQLVDVRRLRCSEQYCTDYTDLTISVIRTRAAGAVMRAVSAMQQSSPSLR